MLDRAKRLSSTQDFLLQECKNLNVTSLNVRTLRAFRQVSHLACKHEWHGSVKRKY